MPSNINHHEPFTPKDYLATNPKSWQAAEAGRDRQGHDELGTVPQWKAIRDNLDALVINDGHIEVHVGYVQVAGNRACSSGSAHVAGTPEMAQAHQ